MKHKEFYDEHHARSYLIGSIIRLGKQPIFIRELQAAEEQRINKKFRVIYSRVGEHNNSILFLPNSNINMIPVPLGMMSTEEGTWYVQRQPTRGWKIGLNPENISYQIISGRPVKNIGLRREQPDVSFNSQELNNCILGNHPSYNDALQLVMKGNKHSQAFSRQFAINRGGLVFKSIDDTVGVCERNKPILFDHFQYLQEVLEEDLLR